MTSRRDALMQKLSFLYERLSELEEAFHVDRQTNFLMNEIDYCRTELLRLDVREYNDIIRHEDD